MLEIVYTSKRYHFQNSTLSPILLFRVNNLKGTAEAEHAKSYQNCVFNPKKVQQAARILMGVLPGSLVLLLAVVLSMLVTVYKSYMTSLVSLITESFPTPVRGVGIRKTFGNLGFNETAVLRRQGS